MDKRKRRVISGLLLPALVFVITDLLIPAISDRFPIFAAVPFYAILTLVAGLAVAVVVLYFYDRVWLGFYYGLWAKRVDDQDLTEEERTLVKQSYIKGIDSGK